MNKTEFIKALSNKINYNIDDCKIINDILEKNFFISKKSKEKIINELMDKFNIDYEKSNSIYESAIEIINTEIKYKLKHPFKSK